ncbi:MAG: alkaline phosphatase [Acidobacteria bacterium]|nr:alkaline phosphatase [Acidobacteriota bacterium]
MKHVFCLVALFSLTTQIAQAQARNVILFLGDACGIPTLNVASIYRYGEPQKLFVQHMPYIALMDTSTADVWVTDSAAGMTAIVTGQKTKNGIISQSATAVRGKQDGEILQTILEHAEQRGLSTGVLSNMNITDATTAACFAHSNDRRAAGPIFAQVFTPRFGDGVDVVIGAGRDLVLAATEKIGVRVESAAREKGYAFYDSLQAISEQDTRVIALFNTHDFDVWQATERAIRALSKNQKGYFLMVEWDAHTDNLKRGLKQTIELDDAIRKTADFVKSDTLIIFAADHSFDIRLRGGKRSEPLLAEDKGSAPPTAQAVPNVRVDDGHTGEEVLVAAQGPGAERVRGFIANTDLFHIMMAAFGWETWPKTTR